MLLFLRGMGRVAGMGLLLEWGGQVQEEGQLKEEEQLIQPGIATWLLLQVLEGVEPNEHGTWQYGRNGWCDGQDVKAWVADITADVAPAEGTTNTIVYYGLLHGQDPQPQQPPGYILMQSNLVLYTSSGAEAGEGPGTKGDGELTAAAAA